MDKKGRIDIVRQTPLIVIAARHPTLAPLINDRYQWPIAIVVELMRAKTNYGAGYPLRASELIDAGKRLHGLKAIGAPYVRDLISALREGGAPIASERYQGYWWDG